LISITYDNSDYTKTSLPSPTMPLRHHCSQPAVIGHRTNSKRPTLKRASTTYLATCQTDQEKKV
jgi:hypothetical protein